MRLQSAFDVLGPVMAGPSSSHTAGALRIAQFAASLCRVPVRSARFTLYNSFARTYRGHGTDRALLAGLMGMHSDDPRIRDSFETARARGISWEFAPSEGGEGLHPNTVDISVGCADGSRVKVRGESVGGGRIHVSRINGVDVDISGRMPTIVVAHRDTPGMLAAITSELGRAGVNIAYMSSYRTSPGADAYAVFETDEEPEAGVVERIGRIPDVMAAYSVHVPGVLTLPTGAGSDYDFSSGAQLLALCRERACSIGQAMARRERDLRGEGESSRMMARVLSVMREEATEPIISPAPSLGGLIGGQARRVSAGAGGPSDVCGPVLTRAMACAMAVLERSAAMGVIVAAPTAGSSGVVPGCLIALQERLGFSDEAAEEGLYAAAAVGALIEHAASVSGAEGGCQAEVGSASAMAAAMAVQLLGGTPEQALSASTTAIANLLGLVCDPVRGLVEVPCQSRNAIGVADALTAAQLAMCGVALPLPFDEAAEAMRQVGEALPASLRETALGGLAACPSAAGAGAAAGCGGCEGCALG